MCDSVVTARHRHSHIYLYISAWICQRRWCRDEEEEEEEETYNERKKTPTEITVVAVI